MANSNLVLILGHPIYIYLFELYFKYDSNVKEIHKTTPLIISSIFQSLFVTTNSKRSLESFSQKYSLYIYKGCSKINARFELNIKESF